MKHSYTTKTFAIAAISALALCVAPAAKADDKGCSNTTLQGSFSFIGTGFFVSPARHRRPDCHCQYANLRRQWRCHVGLRKLKPKRQYRPADRNGHI